MASSKDIGFGYINIQVRSERSIYSASPFTYSVVAIMPFLVSPHIVWEDGAEQASESVEETL